MWFRCAAAAIRCHREEASSGACPEGRVEMVKELVDQSAMDDALVREGDAWVLLMLSGASTHADARALRAWRERSSAHENAFREAVRLRRLVRGAGRQLREPPARLGAVIAANQAGRRMDRRALMAGGMAASIAVGVVGVVGGRALHQRSGERPGDWVTAKGERRQVDLGGGVVAELNTLSRLRRRTDLGVHGIELVSGEAVFTAHVPPDRPLVAWAGGGRTVASDARFSLRCTNAGVSVACLDGAVMVEAAGGGHSVPPGHGIAYDDHGVGALVAVDPAVATAWQHGVLMFRQQRVGAVIGEINRYRSGRIVVTDAALANRRIDGAFYLNQLDQIFDQLHAAYGATVTRLPGGLVVLT